MASQIAGLYDMEDTLGSGHFAVVKSARHVFTGLRVAIKVIDKMKLDEVSKAHLYQEVRCMKLVVHPSIIRLYEVIDTQTKLYLIQELGDGGDLYDFIMKHPNGIEESLARQIFRQTVSAIRYCHKLHVVHRDLKPENLVFCTGGGRDLRVKLTDFGLSRTFLPGELIESSCGSLEYSAPEILLGDSYDPPKVDVWSLGVILFMLISGRSPFASGGASETLTHIMDGKYYVPNHVTDSCKNLISTMLVVDPLLRASLEVMAHHPWLLMGVGEDPTSLPVYSNFEEIPLEDVDIILHRMVLGGYGSREDLLRAIQETPYGSTAATFFLLAEAERHRKLRPMGTPTRGRKASLPTSMLNGPLMSPKSPSKIVPSPFKSVGSAETGVLQRRTPIATPTARTKAEEVSTPRRLSNEVTLYANATPTRAGNFYSSPQVGVGGEQLSQRHTPKPAFPLNIQPSQEEPKAKPAEHIDHTPSFRPTRQLSTFEEESETESLPEGPCSRPLSLSPQSRSPMRSPRSRRLLNSRSSPLIGPASKSDPSDEEDEDDDDIVELMTTSGRFTKASTFPRLSPSTSPLLTSRRSPTHCWTGSSDEEMSNIFDSTHKHRSKRLAYHRKRGPPLARVDSVSSDDGGGQRDRQRRPTSRNREKLLRMRQYNSLPATPADTAASESLTELLENIRRQRSGSTRTDSSLSDHDGVQEGAREGSRSSKGEKDMNDLANSLVSRFDLSDDDVERSCEMETDSSQRRTAYPLRSAYCCVL